MYIRKATPFGETMKLYLLLLSTVLASTITATIVDAQSKDPNDWNALLIGYSNDGHYNGFLLQSLASWPERTNEGNEFAALFVMEGVVILSGEHTPDYIDEGIPHNGIASVNWYQQEDYGMRIGFGSTLYGPLHYTVTAGAIIRTWLLLAESNATGWYWRQDSRTVELFTWGTSLHFKVTQGFRLGIGWYSRQGFTAMIGGAW